jgi:hypothetical protein
MEMKELIRKKTVTLGFLPSLTATKAMSTIGR